MTDCDFIQGEERCELLKRTSTRQGSKGRQECKLGMDLSLSPTLKRIALLDLFCAWSAQKSPMPGLLLLLLLLCCLSLSSCQDEECLLGIVGQSVTLPCLYPQLLTLVNFSIEWRRDEEVVLRSVWEMNKKIEELGVNSATISDDAEQTGNFSLELPTVEPRDHEKNHSLFIVSHENQSAPLCTVCLRITASFSSPRLQREEAAEGEETAFLCHTIGGFPEPAVHWLINKTKPPREGEVWTEAAVLPDSQLYNITSHLRANLTKETTVSCTVENLPMNETLTSTSYGVKGSPVVGRASDAMWIFSTGLCAVVGVMVVAGVAYQIHLDRISKKKKKEFQHLNTNRGYKRRFPDKEEMETMNPKETDV